MGGFFGAASLNDCINDVFFGTDYHSHLGTKRGGMTAYSPELGFQRSIHSIENSPFRTKFEKDIETMKGNLCIGCISDTDPQPILLRSKLGLYAVCNIGIINNAAEIRDEILNDCFASFESMSSGKVNSSSLIGALIAQKDNFVDGIRNAQEKIKGTVSLMVLTEDGIIAARDKAGKLPIIVGKRDDGYCYSFESFAFQKLGYEIYKELKPGEIVKITPTSCETLSPGTDEMSICTFLWTYYGYPNSIYEGVNVEAMRMRNGEIMAEADIKNGCLPDVDYICGVPDSGIPHAIGYSNEKGIPYKRPFVKYTPTWPRSFMPQNQNMRDLVAKMKLLPNEAFTRDARIVFLDDSIVRGTQLKDNVVKLRECGVKEVHIRIACPPLIYPCCFLNFSTSRSTFDLFARRVIRDLEGTSELTDEILKPYSDPDSEKYKEMVRVMCQHLQLDSLQFQRLDDLVKAIGLPKEQLCTHCWDNSSYME